MVDRRQVLAGKHRKCCRLVPAHPPDREVGFSVGVDSGIPRCWTSQSRGVTKSPHRIFPGDASPAFNERLAPIVAPAVAALIDELLELPVSDLESIDPIVIEVTDPPSPSGIVTSYHTHHARRDSVHRIEPEAHPGR